jgi:hypothetical protein
VVAQKLVLTVLEPGNAMISEPRLVAPHNDITVPKQERPYRIATLRPAELEGGRKTQRHGNDRVRIVALVPVLMQRRPGCRNGPAAWSWAVGRLSLGVMVCETGSERVGPRHHRGTATEHFAGIDVSLKDSSVCVVGAAGRIVREAKGRASRKRRPSGFAGAALR